jgi:2-amino-4-hydroxy-6-hydroxymethyldihydropteridine diphosphokinase
MDLDVLFYGDRVIEDGELIVPHPRLHQRRFVLEPLAELAPEWRHPVLGRTVQELLAGLPATPATTRLAPAAGSRYGSLPSCSSRPSAG